MRIGYDDVGLDLFCAFLFLFFGFMKLVQKLLQLILSILFFLQGDLH